MVEKFYRYTGLRDALGFDTVAQVREAIRRGALPMPDGYIGARSPIWRKETVERIQREALTRPRPKRALFGANAKTERRPSP